MDGKGLGDVWGIVEVMVFENGRDEGGREFGGGWVVVVGVG